MKIEIRKEVFRTVHPQMRFAFFLVDNIHNDAHLQESYHLVKEAEKYVRLTFNKDSLKNHHLISPWITAQEEFGTKARHYHSSVERLLKKVLDKKEVTSRNVVANVTNYLTLKHLIPFSVDDFEQIQGGVQFRIAKGTEKKSMLSKLRKGDLYYHDDAHKDRILGAKLDYWKSSRTKLKKNSWIALVHIEALPPVSVKEFNALVKETKGLLESFTQGRVKVLKLDAYKPAGEFKFGVKKSLKKKVVKKQIPHPPHPRRISNKPKKR